MITYSILTILLGILMNFAGFKLFNAGQDIKDDPLKRTDFLFLSLILTYFGAAFWMLGSLSILFK
jgi:hypothetical protein